MVTRRYERYPTKRLLISHVDEGFFTNKLGILFTVLGKVKRLKLMGKILERREFFNTVDNKGVNYMLGDGTGKLRALLYEDNDSIKEGDLVKVIGLIKEVDGKKYVNIEIIKKMELESFQLHKRYHELLIALKIKTKGIINLEEAKKFVDLI